MTYEAQFWEMGGDDGNLVADFEDRLRRLVDENVRAATTEFWSKVRLSVRKGDDGVFLLEAWAEDAVGDEAVRAIPLIELGGFDAGLLEPEDNERLAEIFDALAQKSRAASAQFRQYRRSLGCDSDGERGPE